MQKKAEFQSVNDVVYQWYRLVRQRNVPVSGPITKNLYNAAIIIKISMTILDRLFIMQPPP